MELSIETELEDDGRWIAEVLALRVLAERLEQGESKPLEISISLASA